MTSQSNNTGNVMLPGGGGLFSGAMGTRVRHVDRRETPRRRHLTRVSDVTGSESTDPGNRIRGPGTHLRVMGARHTGHGRDPEP